MALDQRRSLRLLLELLHLPLVGRFVARVQVQQVLFSIKGQRPQLGHAESSCASHLEHLECSHQPHTQGRGAKKRTKKRTR